MLEQNLLSLTLLNLTKQSKISDLRQIINLAISQNSSISAYSPEPEGKQWRRNNRGGSDSSISTSVSIDNEAAAENVLLQKVSSNNSHHHIEHHLTLTHS